MIRISASARIHFGLLRLPNPGEPRVFGGCGLTLKEPRTIVHAERSGDWNLEGPERLPAIVERIVRRFSLSGAAFVRVESSPPEHVGFGSGTQLTLAVAAALLQLWEFPMPKITVLARELGRADRSSIGTHAFAGGGFLWSEGVETERILFPERWCVVTLQPRAVSLRWCGVREQKVFHRERNPTVMENLSSCMSQLLKQTIVPAILQGDFATVSESLHDYNRLSGRMYTEDQGGDYAAPEIEQLVQTIRSLGIAGVGQSSWGPTVFALTQDKAQAQELKEHLSRYAEPGTLRVSLPDNQGFH